jgi:hypothetical protein
MRVKFCASTANRPTHFLLLPVSFIGLAYRPGPGSCTKNSCARAVPPLQSRLSRDPAIAQAYASALNRCETSAPPD